MKMYDWGVFFEDGNKASLPVPFGPEHPDNMIGDLKDPWIEKVTKLFPTFVSEMENMNLPFGFIIVNPPREATPEEAAYYKDYERKL